MNKHTIKFQELELIVNNDLTEKDIYFFQGMLCFLQGYLLSNENNKLEIRLMMRELLNIVGELE